MGLADLICAGLGTLAVAGSVGVAVNMRQQGIEVEQFSMIDWVLGRFVLLPGAGLAATGARAQPTSPQDLGVEVASCALRSRGRCPHRVLAERPMGRYADVVCDLRDGGCRISRGSCWRIALKTRLSHCVAAVCIDRRRDAFLEPSTRLQGCRGRRRPLRPARDRARRPGALAQRAHRLSARSTVWPLSLVARSRAWRASARVMIGAICCRQQLPE